MDFTNSLFISGIIIGLGVSAPIGPIATFIIRQTLTYGLLSGLVAALASMLADGFYAWVAAVLSSFIQNWMEAHSRWFYLLGGAFLMYIGIKILMSHVKYNNNDKKSLEPALISSFLHTSLLTFASPMTTILFIGWFKAMGTFEQMHTSSDIAAVVIGVMVGAIAWWGLLTTILTKVQKKYDLKIFKYINLIAGSGIVLFSLVTIGKALLTA